VQKLFYDSLVMFGVLSLGSKESLRFSEFEECYERLDPREKIYKKIR
jgi:chemotaxis protein methyltransferase CheR